MFHGERALPRDAPQSTLEALLREGVGALALEPDDAQIVRLAELARLLSHWGRRINLTAHRSPEQIVRRLILDAAALLDALPELAGELDSLADVGSGAGFPGLPMAILRPRLAVTLIESRERRHHFQRAAIRDLDLENVEPVLGRAEQLVAQPHAAAVAQAVALPDMAAERLLPWVAPGGLLLLPGAASGPELEGGRALAGAVRSYQVPLGGPARTVWLGRRALE